MMYRVILAVALLLSAAAPAATLHHDEFIGTFALIGEGIPFEDQPASGEDAHWMRLAAAWQAGQRPEVGLVPDFDFSGGRGLAAGLVALVGRPEQRTLTLRDKHGLAVTATLPATNTIPLPLPRAWLEKHRTTGAAMRLDWAGGLERFDLTAAAIEGFLRALDGAAADPAGTLARQAAEMAESEANAARNLECVESGAAAERAEIERAAAGPPPRPLPRTIAEARARQALIAGEEMKQDGGVARRGPVQLNVKGLPFGAYDEAMIAAIQSRWFRLLDESRHGGATGRVRVRFDLHQDGSVRVVEPAETTVDALFTGYCVRAVSDPAPYGRWPSDMARMAGSNPRECTVTFYYQPARHQPSQLPELKNIRLGGGEFIRQKVDGRAADLAPLARGSFLVPLISVAADGTVKEVEVERGSGSSELDAFWVGQIKQWLAPPGEERRYRLMVAF